MTTQGESIARAIEVLRVARSVVVTTGAGMSKESGVATFRDAPSALWANYNPEDLATRAGFARNPAMVWRWYAERRATIAKTKPHAGHVAIARMQRFFDGFLLVTQNIDNLHTEAGSPDVVELHGNIFRFKCFDREHPARDLAPGGGEPPRCACGSFLRPDVVWFGEMLDPDHLERVYAALVHCDVVLVVGTSGLVYPAAGIPAAGRAAGASVIEVNPEETPVTEIADVFVRAPAGEALPAIADGIARHRRSRQTD